MAVDVTRPTDGNSRRSGGVSAAVMSTVKTRPAARRAQVPHRTTTWLATVSLAAVTGVACGNLATTRPTPTGQSARAGAAGSVSIATSAPTSSEVIVLTEADNGKTVVIGGDQLVRLELHSTYWMISGSQNPSVLRPTSGQTAVPSPGCVPGQGCGTVFATYQTVSDGHSRLVASRITCGEALACTPSNGTFAVLVIVQG
jgi:hypothetical protein